jgi:hypothetical protein
MHSFADSGAELNSHTRHLALSQLLIRTIYGFSALLGHCGPEEKDTRYIAHPHCDSLPASVQEKPRVVELSHLTAIR